MLDLIMGFSKAQ